jgi:GxxExxY protein
VDENGLAVVVVDAALAVHKALGPGLLESVYVAALAIQLTERQLHHEREVPIHATYRDRPLGIAYRADLVVASKLLVEVKAVDGIHDAHIAQTLSYLRLTGLRLGLLINFSAPLIKHGIKRVVNNL